MRKRGNMGKSTALALAFSLLLALLLPGCSMMLPAGTPAPAEDWDTTIDITDAFNDALEDALEDILDGNQELLDSIDISVKDFTIDVTVSVNDDGGYELTVNEKRLKRTLDDVVETLFDSMGGSSSEGWSSNSASRDGRLIGNWVCYLDLTDMIYDEIEYSVGDDIQYFSFHDFFLKLNMSLGSDGTVRLSVDETALERSLNTLIEDVMDGLELYFETYAWEEGIYVTLEEYLMDELGCTMDEFVDEMLYEAGFDMDDMVSSVSEMNISGTYEADGINLTLTSGGGTNTLSYTLSGDTLTLYSDFGGMFGDTMVFTKK